MFFIVAYQKERCSKPCPYGKKHVCCLDNCGKPLKDCADWRGFQSFVNRQTKRGGGFGAGRFGGNQNKRQRPNGRGGSFGGGTFGGGSFGGGHFGYDNFEFGNHNNNDGVRDYVRSILQQEMDSVKQEKTIFCRAKERK